ncbi:hypothetical protein M0Q28_04765 [Patescibacteria group bacterium]|jgi:hypothetical protein|nr:hypothetical protein [Patescibacteria group bacterium]
MTHTDLDKLYDEVLGRGSYMPQVLLPRIKRALESEGFDVSLDASDDLMKLPIEAVPAAIKYLNGYLSKASPDADHAARLVRKRSQSGTHRKAG